LQFQQSPKLHQKLQLLWLLQLQRQVVFAADSGEKGMTGMSALSEGEGARIAVD
jgi:hypothetical protein